VSGSVNEPAREQGSHARPLFAALGEHRLVAGAILGVLALQVFMIFTQSLNWDEFFHYSQVYELARGQLTRDYQVLHARVFAWVPWLKGDVITQLQIARVGMLGFELITLVAVVGLARQFTDRTAAWLAGLAWLSGGYVFLHGFSFRSDPMATAGLMVALYIMARSKLNWLAILLASLAIALAFMATLKSALYAPCFAGVAWLRFTRSEDRWGLVQRCAAVAVLAPLLFGSLYFLHRAGLPVATPTTAGLLPSGGTRFFAEGLFPRGLHVLLQLIYAPVLPLALLAALWVTLRQRGAGAELVAIGGLLAPALAVVLYRNAFPYYFVFALAPFAVAAATGFAWLQQRHGQPATVAVLLLSPIMLTVTEPRQLLPRQRAVLAEVNRLYPVRPLHLSYSGMPADYPRVVNHLVSGIGIESYYHAGRPRIAEAVATGELRFVIADTPIIVDALTGKPVPRTLLPEDVAALRRNYVHYWGPLWLPGRQVTHAGTLDIELAGEYSLGEAAIVLDGVRVDPGETVVLDKGIHRAAPTGARPATLWLGNRAPVPPAKPLKGPYYAGFR
jgi:hypothetical protein